jgi:hypothetical protein
MVHVQQEEREGLPVVEQILLHVTDIYRASPRVETKMPFYNFEKFTFSRKYPSIFIFANIIQSIGSKATFCLPTCAFAPFTHIF